MDGSFKEGEEMDSCARHVHRPEWNPTKLKYTTKYTQVVCIWSFLESELPVALCPALSGCQVELGLRVTPLVYVYHTLTQVCSLLLL